MGSKADGPGDVVVTFSADRPHAGLAALEWQESSGFVTVCHRPPTSASDAA